MSSVWYAPFELELEAPALFTAPGGDPNSSVSWDFVPGSVVRGSVARVLGDPDDNPAVRSRFDDWILSGRVAYLNAYPLVDDTRALPTPLSWRRAKYGDAWYDNWLEDPPGTIAAGVAFVSPGEEHWREVPVRKVSTIHQQRDRPRGRATRTAGAVFLYEALAAGQTFAGRLAIRAENAEAAGETATAIGEALGSKLYIGRSRRAGYGGSATFKIDTNGLAPREAQDDGLEVSGAAAGGTVRVLLTSDYIGRAPTGQPDPTAFEAELLQALGGRAAAVRRWFGFRRAGSFNRKWKLETPQVATLRAGSVLEIRFEKAAEGENLRSLEGQGLGERRTEGFGRFLFLPAPESSPRVRSTSGSQSQENPQEPPGRLVQRMEQRHLRRALRRRTERVAATLCSEVKNDKTIPTGSLLNRLRQPLRDGDSGLAKLETWLGKGNGGLKPAAREQLEDCRLKTSQGEESLLERLAGLTKAKAHDLAKLIDIASLAKQRHLTTPENAQQILEAELPTARRWLLEDVLQLMALKQRKAPEKSR